jgi:hypothetical protein
MYDRLRDLLIGEQGENLNSRDKPGEITLQGGVVRRRAADGTKSYSLRGSFMAPHKTASAALRSARGVNRILGQSGRTEKPKKS